MSEGVVQNNNEKTGSDKGQSDTPDNKEVEERLNRIAAQLFGGNKGK